MVNSRDIIQKADIAVSNLKTDGGYLNPEQANKFIDIVINQPTIINSVRTVRMGAPKRKIEKIGFGSRILHAAPTSGTALADSDRSKPDLGMVELETKEIIAEVWIPYDVLEDNIEKDNLENTIIQKIGERAALDLEELLIRGDTASADPYLAVTDGIIELTPTANIVNASAITNIDKKIFKYAINKMPTKYLRNVSMMRHFVSHQVEVEYRDTLADKDTNLGDSMITGRNPAYAFGIPIIPCALMPNNKLLLTYPNNIIFGIQRQILIETDKDIRKRVLVIVLTMRCDIKLEQADASVVVEKFKDSDLPTTTT